LIVQFGRYLNLKYCGDNGSFSSSSLEVEGSSLAINISSLEVVDFSLEINGSS